MQTADTTCWNPNGLQVVSEREPTAEEMMDLTGMKVGGVTPFSLPESLPLYVDHRIMDLDWVILGGGGRSTKIQVTPEVFTKLGAEVITDLGKE